MPCIVRRRSLKPFMAMPHSFWDMLPALHEGGIRDERPRPNEASVTYASAICSPLWQGAKFATDCTVGWE